ncbi:MAG: pantoate--beta-alanine ligase [Betaproteobacteria bacterium]|nr:pantoate--beta-alanine ligase [Betaproteobacteria bacterium]
MQRIHSVADLHAALAGARSSVLVPTMGNLHEGHLQLVRHAGSLGAPVVASVFVNRLQFGVGEDFDRYPRTLDDDATALAGAGCDILFAPDERELYPHPQQILIQPPPEADQLCGAHRAGHFAGAPQLYQALCRVRDRACGGHWDPQALAAGAERELEARGWRVDYVALRDAVSLREPDARTRDWVVLAAARLGDTRLIDNLMFRRL